MSKKFYTGVGSIDCPERYFLLLKKYSEILSRNGYVLRSGGAAGADTACEEGCDKAGGEKEIYLPYKNFNRNKSSLFNVCQGALKIASEVHPAWRKCNWLERKFIGRDVYQVLGLSLDGPSDIVLAYTNEGHRKGGTATALNLGDMHGAAVYNIGIESDIERFENEVILPLSK